LIKIRYAELAAGLHVRVEARGRSTIIYLLPGLTLAQRRAALLRARRSAAMGYGPALPVAGVVAAVARDRIRATISNGTSAFRAHPILLLPMIVVLSATMVYIMTSAVTITLHPPQGGSLPGLTVGRGGHHDQHGLGTDPVGVGSEVGPSPSVSDSPRPGQPTRSGRPTRSPRPTRSSPAPHSSSPAPTSSSPDPGSSSPPPGTSSPPAPAPTPTSTGTCLQVGPLGICLHL
jgi:hypothetical protein